MAGRPLRIAFWMLTTGICLVGVLALYSLPTTSQQGALIAEPNADVRHQDNEVTPHRDASVAVAGVPEDESASKVTVPSFVDVGDFPGISNDQQRSIADAVFDHPDGPASVPLRVVSRSTDEHRIRRRGFEELPPPPHFMADTTDVEFPEPPAVTRERVPEVHSEQLALIETQLNDLRKEFAKAKSTSSEEQLAELKEIRKQLAQSQTNTEVARLESVLSSLTSRQNEIKLHLETLADQQAESARQALTTTESEKSEDDPIEVTRLPGIKSRWRVTCRDASLAKAIGDLSQKSKRNIALGAGLPDSITIALNDTTLDDALAAVASAAGGSMIERDGVTLIVPSAVADQQAVTDERMVARLIRPHYISAEVVAGLIEAMLTPGYGRVSSTRSYDGMQDTRVQRDALLVVDYPDVIEQVDALLRELDQPGPEFEIEAVVTTVRCLGGQRCRALEALRKHARVRRISSRNAGASGSCLECFSFSGVPEEVLGVLRPLGTVHVETMPHLRVLNRQTADIRLEEEIAYRESICCGKTRRSNGETIGFLPSLTRLEVRPELQGSDSIRLLVEPQHTQHFYDPLTQLPRRSTAGMRTDVLIQDGCTLVIGGLTHHTQTDLANLKTSKRKTSWWSSLRRRSAKHVEQSENVEVLILITPKRVHPEEPCRVICDPPQGPIVPPPPVTSAPDSAVDVEQLGHQKPVATDVPKLFPQELIDRSLREVTAAERTSAVGKWTEARITTDEETAGFSVPAAGAPESLTPEPLELPLAPPSEDLPSATTVERPLIPIPL